MFTIESRVLLLFAKWLVINKFAEKKQLCFSIGFQGLTRIWKCKLGDLLVFFWQKVTFAIFDFMYSFINSNFNDKSATRISFCVILPPIFGTFIYWAHVTSITRKANGEPNNTSPTLNKIVNANHKWEGIFHWRFNVEKKFPAPRSEPANFWPRSLFILQPYLSYNFHGSTRLGPQVSLTDMLRRGCSVGGVCFKRSQVGATLLTWVQIPAVA